MEKIDIKSLRLHELEQKLLDMKLPKFRTKQIYTWLHQKFVSSFEGMTNLSLDLREQLDCVFYINKLKIKKKLVSEIDGTIKYLFELADGNCIESVLMRYKHGNSLCISSQVGCKMGCNFCASTLGGLVRNLTPSELLDQVYAVTVDSGEKVSNIVMMGIGEPLDNFENVLAFLDILSSADGLELSLRHVSLSTCGIVEKIDELAKRKLGLTLSVSLHAPNNEVRDTMMPINKRWNVEQLLDACERYFNATGRRISFEYALIHGVNDSEEHAVELAKRLRGTVSHVNLIPVNNVQERNYVRANSKRIHGFKESLLKKNINATIRRELGADINAACGQLRRNTELEG